MTNIGSFTYLEYTIVPSPLAIDEKQEIIILATLKTSVQNQGKLTSVAIDNIVLNFGTTGTAGTNLCSSANAMTESDFIMNSDWLVIAGEGTGMSFKVSPSSTSISKGTITSNALIIKIKDVVVNDTPGNATITITETVSQVNGGSSSGNVNQASLVLPKVESDDSGISFTSNPDHMQAGNKTVLSWNAPDEKDAVFSLQYLQQGQLIKISKHQNGDPLNYVDQYPGVSDPALILGETTIFILSILSNGVTRTLTVPVIVSQADIYASTLTVEGTQSSPTSFKLNGHMQMTDSGNNGVMYIPEKNTGKFWFRSGNDQNYQELAQIGSDGDLNVTGNITVGGSVTTSKNYITDNTPCSVGGWKGGTAKWLSPNSASSGGTSIGTIDGFSITYATGNYGYYEIDLGQVVKGIFTVEMFLTNLRPSGQGFWNIISAYEKFNNSKFNIGTSYQVWSTQQDTSWGQLYDQYIVTQLVRTYIKGQYIYIGAIDLGQGQVGLAINRTSLQPLT